MLRWYSFRWTYRACRVPNISESMAFITPATSPNTDGISDTNALYVSPSPVDASDAISSSPRREPKAIRPGDIDPPSRSNDTAAPSILSKQVSPSPTQIISPFSTTTFPSCSSSSSSTLCEPGNVSLISPLLPLVQTSLTLLNTTFPSSFLPHRGGSPSHLTACLRSRSQFGTSGTTLHFSPSLPFETVSLPGDGESESSSRSGTGICKIPSIQTLTGVAPSCNG